MAFIIVIAVKNTVQAISVRSLSGADGNVAKGNIWWLRLRSATWVFFRSLSGAETTTPLSHLDFFQVVERSRNDY
ncbi:MAG: hypothetical protein AB8F95_21245 [Bacteroidia bacterium]